MLDYVLLLDNFVLSCSANSHIAAAAPYALRTPYESRKLDSRFLQIISTNLDQYKYFGTKNVI